MTTERPLLVEEDPPREAGDIADAIASVPSSSGYRALLQALFRGKMSAAAIALVVRQVVIMGLSVGSSVAVEEQEHDEHPFGRIRRIIDSDDLSSRMRMRGK